MVLTMYELMLCHFLGDYIFQTDFLAKTKGEKGDITRTYYVCERCGKEKPLYKETDND